MNKILYATMFIIITIGLSILVTMKGWGLEPVSWPWLIFGHLGIACLGGLFKGVNE